MTCTKVDPGFDLVAEYTILNYSRVSAYKTYVRPTEYRKLYFTRS